MRDYSKRKIDYINRKRRAINYDTYIQVRVDKELKDKLYKISEEKGIPISEFVREVLQNYRSDT